MQKDWINKIKSSLISISPIRVLIIYLLLMAFFATKSWGGDLMFWIMQIVRLGLIYLGMRGSYFLLSRIITIKDSGRVENRIITTLILYLLFDPLIPLWVFLVVGVASEAISRKLRSLTGPILNPAAAGAMCMILLGYMPGWWGMSFSPRIYIIPDGISLSVFLTLILAGFVAYKYKKLYIAVITGLFYFMTTTFFKGSAFSMFVMSEGTVMFFLLVMLIEPKTSPALEKDQLIYGLIVGLAVTTLLLMSFADPYSGGLLIGNLSMFLIMWSMKRNKLVLPTLLRYGQIKKI